MVFPKAPNELFKVFTTIFLALVPKQRFLLRAHLI